MFELKVYNQNGDLIKSDKSDDIVKLKEQGFKEIFTLWEEYAEPSSYIHYSIFTESGDEIVSEWAEDYD